MDVDYDLLTELKCNIWEASADIEKLIGDFDKCETSVGVLIDIKNAKLSLLRAKLLVEFIARG